MTVEKEVKIQQVIAALEYLKRIAENENLDDIVDLIDATFRICSNTYIILKRSELAESLLVYKGLTIVS
ncbi:MAG: hypothetical protein WBK77_08145 [Alphaproteobacteria bacterium]